jgi:hypothetical protein
MTKLTACALTERNPLSDMFKGAHEGHEGLRKLLHFNFLLRAVRVLAGEMSVSILLAALPR